MGRNLNWVEILDVPAAQRTHSERIRNARTAASVSADVVLLEREQRKDSVRVDTDFKSSPYGPRGVVGVVDLIDLEPE